MPNATPNDVSKENQQHRKTLEEKVNALSSLIEVGIIINSTVQLNEVMKLVMEKALGVMNAEASAVFLINAEKHVFEIPVALGDASAKFKTIEIPMDVGIAGAIAKSGEAEIIPDAYKDSRFNAKVDKETGFVTRSILAAPLKVRDKLIGVAEVINRNDGNAFDEDDLNLFSAFCRQVAMAIENARVHQLELDKQRIEQQLEAAKHIQQSFMPESLPKSADRQFEVAARSLAAASVGGDLFDFMEFGEQLLGVTIGDVSGKGIPAALYMARLVSDFRLFSQTHRDPAELMAILNKALTERSSRGMFVTFFYGVLYADNGKFCYANAGHLPLIHIESETGEIQQYQKVSGIPLGVVPNFLFEQHTIRLNKGDYLVLVTDGVVEAKNKSGEMYSFERLVDLLKTPQDSAEALLDLLLNDVQSFSEGFSQHDDVTAVVLKWH
ncbi:MAG: SpoIIE family protein phosphatase [Calditrichae bacterium]|nr:SpoIIE family protein phosphatase [Calditrichia bacterium]